MDKYSVDKVERRTDYVQYIYKNTEAYPTTFEGFAFPIAIYSRVGTIVGANKIFREIIGITQDDIQKGSGNIFDVLNAELTETAQSVFYNVKKVIQDKTPLIRKNGKTDNYRIEQFPNAIFFPMSYKRGSVECGAILLDWIEETDDG